MKRPSRASAAEVRPATWEIRDQEAQEYSTGTAYTKTVTTKYDAAGNRSSQVYPSGLALTYSFNDINALSSVTDGTNTIASFSYIGFRPKVTTFGNGATQTNTYGGFREDLTTVHHETSAPATLVRMDYAYNKVHDRTFERFGASGSAGDAFEYDKARRLTKAWMGSSTPASPSGNTYVQTIAYNMDDDGNRSSVVVTPYGVSPTTTSYSANNLNQYTAVGGTSQSHDANGNLTNNGTLTFKYNYRNLITEVRQSSGGALVAEYLYDANGRRVVKSVSGGIFERYIYADVETISVLDGSQAWKQDFVFDVTGIDRILMLEQADVLDQDGDSNTTEITRSYYHRNALGSVMEISTASQTEAASYRYAPYGERTISRAGSVQSSDPLGQSWGYTARLHDDESALVYFRARHKSTGTGRFLQRDPIGIRAGASLYEYVRSSPTRLVDPHGLFPGPGIVVQYCRELWDALQAQKAKVNDASKALAAAKNVLVSFGDPNAVREAVTTTMTEHLEAVRSSYDAAVNNAKGNARPGPGGASDEAAAQAKLDAFDQKFPSISAAAAEAGARAQAEAQQALADDPSRQDYIDEQQTVVAARLDEFEAAMAEERSLQARYDEHCRPLLWITDDAHESERRHNPDGPQRRPSKTGGSQEEPLNPWEPCKCK